VIKGRQAGTSRASQGHSAADVVLITFLGTGPYSETSYHWPQHGTAKPTSFVAAALAELGDAARVEVLATEKAPAEKGADLEQTLSARGVPSSIHTLRTGRRDDGRWQQFQVLADLIRGAAARQQEVVLDITHGFRAQPFFAGAVLSVLLATGIRPAHLRVVYGEYRRDEQSTIWSLTQFVEITEWAQALALFTRTGFAAPVVELGRRMRQNLAQRKQHGELTEFPRFAPLIGAIEAFADDLATIRLASIITGYAQADREKTAARGSAKRLLQAIEAHRQEITERLPPLALVLDALEATVRPLIASQLASESGQAAMQALASHYLQRQRYPEAVVVLREAQVCRYAPDDRGIEVNSTLFSDTQRNLADHHFATADPQGRAIAEIRNDIEHAGFRRQPLAADKLRQRAQTLFEHRQVGEPAVKLDPKRWLVSRHPGAHDWLHAQGINADHVVEHLDPEVPAPGDIVIGTFPIHIAAQLCERGVRVQFLAMDLLPGQRGKELAGEEMEACNARIEEYEVRRIGGVEEGEANERD